MYRLANSFVRRASGAPQPVWASSTAHPLRLVATRAFSRGPGGGRSRGGDYERRDDYDEEGSGRRSGRGDRGERSFEQRRERTSGGDLGGWLERRAVERDEERKEQRARNNSQNEFGGDDSAGSDFRRERRPTRGPPRDRDRDSSRGGADQPGFKFTRDRRREEGRPPTLKETMQGTDVLYGVAPVLAALEAGVRRPYRLLIQDTLLSGGAMNPETRKDLKAVEKARVAAIALGATVVEVDKHDLNCLTDNRPHQGLALDCSALEPAVMDEPPAKTTKYQARKYPLWLALDEVTDPQNLGAILRSALFLGADGVLLCSKNSAPLSGVASKASAGALEHFDTVRDVYNMPRFLERCKEEGWAVLGADAGSESKGVREVVVDGPTVLVMGSEGYGLRTNVRRACSGFVMIPSPLAAGDLKNVDSLNVSVAAAILMHELVGKVSE